MYDEYSARVWLYAARWIGSDAQAVADVVQDTFLAAAHSWNQFDPERGSIWAWLSGITHKHVALWWRLRVRDARVSNNPDLDSSAVTTEPTPVAGLELAETVELVRRVLAELNADHAALLIAKYTDGNSLAELLEQFGGTLEGVRSKLARARQCFRDRFAKENPEAADRWLTVGLGNSVGSNQALPNER